MVRSHTGNERGMALGIALFALIILGGLVSSAFFIGVQEQRIGRNAVKLQQAFSAADGGAAAIINGWNIGTYNGMVNGTTVTIGRTALPNSTGWYRGSVQRLSDLMYVIRAEGFNRDSTARQEVGMLARLSPIEIIINAALKTQGATKIGGSSFISGQDQVPTGWTCPATRPTVSAIRIPPADSTDITTSGCGGLTCLQGSPKIKTDSTINDSTLTTFGDVQWADMQAMANKFIGPGNYTHMGPSLVSGACNFADQKNWGDPFNPAGPCGDYFPIIWASGDISINGDIGQGILFVDGNLSVQGGFEFFGPVIVRRTLKTTGTGGHFNGGVISANIDLDQNTILGDAVINYSSCALLKALNASATAAIIKERSWFAVR